MKKPVKSTKSVKSRAAELRRQVEKVSRPPEKQQAMTPAKMRQMLHELQVHQIELEMQKEELQRAQMELESARARYFDLYDLAPVSYCTVNEKGLILEANLTTTALLGVSRDKLIKQPLTRFICKEDQDIYSLHRKKLFDTGEPQTCDLRMTKKAGEIFWANLAATVAEDEDEAKICRVVMKNITERKQVEEELRAEERRFRTLAEQSSDIIVIVNRDGFVIYENPAVERSLGVKTEERIGISIFERIHPDDLKFAKDVFYAFTLNTSSKDIYTPVRQIRLRHQDGSWRTFETVGSKLFQNNIVDAVIINLRDITERKKAEEALKEAELKFRTIFDSASDGIILALANDKKFLIANKTICNMLGYTQEELLKLEISDIHPPESMYYITEQFAKISRKEISILHNIPVIKKDKTFFFTDINSSSICLNGKEYIIGIFRDITERRQAEQALMESEEKYRLLADQSIMGMFIIQNGCIKYSNNATAKITGYSVEEMMNWKPYGYDIVLHPDESSYVMEQARRKQTGDPDVVVNYTWRIITNSGAIKWVDCFSKTISFEGSPADFVMIIDVTEGKTAQEELKMSEANFRLLAENAPDAIFIRTKLRFAYVNNAALHLFGADSPDQLIGQSAMDRFHPDSRELIRERIHLLDEKKMAVPRNEQKYLKLDGTIIDVEASAVPFKYKNIDGSLVFIRDITERKRAEEELKNYREHLEELVKERTIKLEAANKELEAFSYSASHDLRAPLRTIDGFSQAILEDYNNKLDAQGKSYLTRIRKATRLMAELIEDMLKLSRITRADMDIAKVNLSNIAHSVIDGLQKSQPQRHVDVRITDSLEEPADPRLIRIVMENLLGNAWKFTEKQPEAKIEFGLIKKDEENVYFVRDNGAGFDMEYADKLFAPFQRLHNIDEYPGTGIGLAIVKRIITRHAGRVWAEAQVGRGATVYFTLQ
ncbi:MAG: PAS domain S-box protein [Smithella sp.]|jgi:hypothetical protein